MRRHLDASRVLAPQERYPHLLRRVRAASWSGTLRLQGTGLAAGLDRFRGSSKLKYGRCDGGDVEFDDESVP